MPANRPDGPSAARSWAATGIETGEVDRENPEGQGQTDGFHRGDVLLDREGESVSRGQSLGHRGTSQCPAYQS